MERDAGSPDQDTAANEPARASDAARGSAESDGLLDRIGLIESQPLDHRARGFEQLYDELLAELQRSDHEEA